MGSNYRMALATDVEGKVNRISFFQYWGQGLLVLSLHFRISISIQEYI
jgi:hypothetical protein